MMTRIFSMAALAATLALSGCGKSKDEQGSTQGAQNTTQTRAPGTAPGGAAQTPTTPATTSPGSTGQMPGNTAGTAPAGQQSGDPMAAARQVFAMRCSVCHGPDGQGNGPGSANLNPKPRNYTDPAWQASVTDERIKEVITKGGAAVGLSPLMPAHGDLGEQTIDNLVKLIRSFGQKK